MRDIETEEMLEELHGKIRELEKQNGHLKEKVFFASVNPDASCVPQHILLFS